MKKRIVAIAGLAGSGKDTAAQYLIHRHHFTKIAFADSLKDMCSAVFGWPRYMLEGVTMESREWREQVDTWWSTRLQIPHLTPRWVLQHMGTDVLRNHFHDDIWIAALERKLLDCKHGVVITDLRFPNELAAIKRCGGTAVRVQRGVDPPWIKLAIEDPEKFKGEYPDVHPSEWIGVSLEYDYVINNNTSLDDLHAQLREILAKG